MAYKHLAIPGPTPLPYEVLAALQRQPINHRGPEFAELLAGLERKLQRVLQTHSRVYLLTSSGTGAMEAAVANFFSPQDKVLVLENGYFGERFVEMCEDYELDVERLEFGWGKPISALEVEDRLSEDKRREIKGVLFQLNETSTGVLNDAQKILDAIEWHGALSVVDAISGLVAAPFHQDLWGADVVLGASQKGFMAPPGVAFISCSEKACKSMLEKPRSHYFSLRRAEEYHGRGQTYTTPAVLDMFALDAGLDKILCEGLENCWKRHRKLAEAVRNFVRNYGTHYGLELLVKNEKCASPAVTAVKTPERLNTVDFCLALSDKYNTVIAGGQGPLKDKIFRIAHLGHVSLSEMSKILGSIEQCLKDFLPK